MRESRSSGSVEGVLSNGHPYSDYSCRVLLRAFERPTLFVVFTFS